jgi:hypothetical protein
VFYVTVDKRMFRTDLTWKLDMERTFDFRRNQNSLDLVLTMS